MTDYTPLPGDIFLTRIGGPTGAAIYAAQALVAGDGSRYTHAGVILDRDEVIAAQPGGARIDPAATVLADRPLAILPVPDWAQGRRPQIVQAARSLEGHPYGFAAYLWIGLARLGLRPSWLTRAVGSHRTLICSALADAVWLGAEIHLFDDGRMLGAVTPGDLAHVGTVHHLHTGPWPGEGSTHG